MVHSVEPTRARSLRRSVERPVRRVRPRRWARRFRRRERAASTVWLLPSGYVVGALVLGGTMPRLDRHLALQTPWLPEPENARAMLSAIATGMITLTGFVFSFLLLMVQFGSTAFSPRLTRTLQRDRVVQNALGTFSATFVFSLAAMSSVDRVAPGAVPAFTILTVALLLLSSIALFFAMISRASNNLRASHVVSVITARGHEVIDATYPRACDATSRAGDGRPDGPTGDEAGSTPPTPPTSPGWHRLAGTEPVQVVHNHKNSTAVLVGLDRRGLADIARQRGVTIRYMPTVGDDVAPGAELFRIYGDRPVPEGVLRSTLVFGDERTLEDDPGFALRLLVDIAIRALSPAFNDPTTAVRALDGVAELLGHAATRDLDAGMGGDAGPGRVFGPVPTWEDLLRLGVTEVRQYGRGSVQLLRRLRALLEDLLRTTPSVRHPALREELAKLDRTIAESFARDDERQLASQPDAQGLGPRRPPIDQLP